MENLFTQPKSHPAVTSHLRFSGWTVSLFSRRTRRTVQGSAGWTTGRWAAGSWPMTRPSRGKPRPRWRTEGGQREGTKGRRRRSCLRTVGPRRRYRGITCWLDCVSPFPLSYLCLTWWPKWGHSVLLCIECMNQHWLYVSLVDEGGPWKTPQKGTLSYVKCFNVLVKSPLCCQTWIFWRV